MALSRGARALLALSAVYLLFSAAMSALAPCGGWNNAVFGAVLWNEGDPGGYYLPSAHELYSSHGRLLYPGHPGLTLQVLLHAIQAAYFLLFAPRGAEFTPFIAAHLTTVFVLSKLAMTLAHLASFALMLAFARRVLKDEEAALFAAFGYATCWPVAYYLSRVSVEPLMIVCLLGTFLALWRAEDEDSPAWAALAGTAAVLGLATKFHLLWPLPVAGALVLRRRPRPLAAYAAASALALAACSLLLDWRDFFAYWEVPAVVAGGPLRRTLAGLARMPLRNWLPGPTRSGLFLLCEAPLLATAAYGLSLARRGRDEGLARLLWPSVLIGYTVLIWLYRSAAVSGDFHGFHYLFPFMTLAALFFGRGSAALLKRAPAAGKVLWLVLVHGVVLRAVLDARVRDAAYYRRVRPYVAGRPALAGLGVIRDTPPTRSKLIEAAAARPRTP